MKSIQVDDSVYEKLLAIALEVASQDNRATSKPYLFQIQTDEKIWRQDLDGDHTILIDDSCEEIGPFTAKTIQEYCDDNDFEYPSWINESDQGFPFNILSQECEVWLADRDLRLVSYNVGHKLENGFLTEQACKAHIKANSHHYNNPIDYLSHAFRNPELELIYSFLESLVSQQVIGGFVPADA